MSEAEHDESMKDAESTLGSEEPTSEPEEDGPDEEVQEAFAAGWKAKSKTNTKRKE